MTQFKVGDRVRYAKGGYAATRKVGDIGVVTEPSDDFSVRVEWADGQRRSHSLSYLEPVQPEYGAEIAMSGKRPAWLGDDEQVSVQSRYGAQPNWNSYRVGYLDTCFTLEPGGMWATITHLRLPADHPAYTALAAGFEPWGGDADAPDDWDGGEVLRRGGSRHRPEPYVASYGINQRWTHDRGYRGHDIIGYRKRATAEPQDASVCCGCGVSPDLVDRMVSLVRALANTPVGERMPAGLQAESCAICDALPAEPVDPLVVRAREICDRVQSSAPFRYADGKHDDSILMQGVLAALRDRSDA